MSCARFHKADVPVEQFCPLSRWQRVPHPGVLQARLLKFCLKWKAALTLVWFNVWELGWWNMFHVKFNVLFPQKKSKSKTLSIVKLLLSFLRTSFSICFYVCLEVPIFRHTCVHTTWGFQRLNFEIGNFEIAKYHAKGCVSKLNPVPSWQWLPPSGTVYGSLFWSGTGEKAKLWLFLICFSVPLTHEFPIFYPYTTYSSWPDCAHAKYLLKNSTNGKGLFGMAGHLTLRPCFFGEVGWLLAPSQRFVFFVFDGLFLVELLEEKFLKIQAEVQSSTEEDAFAASFAWQLFERGLVRNSSSNPSERQRSSASMPTQVKSLIWDSGSMPLQHVHQVAPCSVSQTANARWNIACSYCIVHVLSVSFTLFCTHRIPQAFVWPHIQILEVL